MLRPMLVLALAVSLAAADDGANRRRAAQEFHARAQERSGLLVPMYVYPANIHTNPEFNRLIELKRTHETLPMWVIVNPASGPGEQVDANYTKAIDRLRGAGCVVIGYVSTEYGKRPVEKVKADIDRWLKLYPKIQGAFFDEMLYENTDTAVKHQVTLNTYAHNAGMWPTVANPGTDTPGRFFEADAADVIVVHENNAWPKESALKQDWFGGYSDYPPHTRAVLLHSTEKIDAAQLRMARKYARWFYVTDAVFDPKDPKLLNPWNRLPKHLDQLCEALAK
ncbi:MAG: spherulation-specific family 4 protein [Gemmataceae bacterium]